MSKDEMTEKIAAYDEWVASGASYPLKQIDDCALLCAKPDLIKGAEPFASDFGMTTPIEQAFCQWYGAHAYQGKGEWIELGSFLGSLTFPGVRGLRVNKSASARDRKIRVYDLFLWDFTMVKFAEYYEISNPPKEGDWYIEFYRNYISKVIDRVEVNQADLTRRGYSREPIEFLLIDVMKYPALVGNVLKKFFPSLKAGSIVFHQDYLHFYESWVTLSMYQMRDYIKCLKALPGGDAVIFEMTGTPDDSVLTFPLESTKIERVYIEEAFEWSRSIMPEDRHPEVYATECMMLFHSGRVDACKELYHKQCSAHSELQNIRDLKRYLMNSGKVDLEA